MDSITQMLLGAAVGEATMGRRIGRKAALWGAALGTLPDLDVLVPYATAVADFTYHRSFSHSLLVHAAITPLIAWLAARIHGNMADSYARWCLLVFGCLATHAALDGLTVYGTQLLWPLVDHPFGASSVFIIDPAYTLPLALGIVVSLFTRRAAGWVNGVGLAISSLYLLFGVGAKLYVEGVLRDGFGKQGIEYERLLTTPAPFNTMLWRYVRIDSSAAYAVGYYSLFDSSLVEPDCFGHAPELVDGLEAHWPVARLKWFTKGFYSVRAVNDEVVMFDLRMGIEDSYVFGFAVADIDAGFSRAQVERQLAPPRNLGRLKPLWRRIRDASVVVEPGAPAPALGGCATGGA